MILLLTILFVLAIWHLLYETVILPVIRTHLRFKLFRLRDELRKLKCDDSFTISMANYRTVEHSINFNLTHMNIGVVQIIYFIVKSRRRKLQMKRYESILMELRRSNCPRLVQIFEESGEIFALSSLACSGSYVLYLVPVVIALFFQEKGKEFAHKFMTNYRGGGGGLAPAH